MRDAIAIVDPLPFNREALQAVRIEVTQEQGRGLQEKLWEAEGPGAQGLGSLYCTGFCPQVLTARTASSRAAARQACRQGPRFLAGTAAEERDALHQDLEQVLGPRMPRRYGQLPHALQHQPDGQQNCFECIAPSPMLERFKKLKKPL